MPPPFSENLLKQPAIEEIRRAANTKLDPQRKSQLGQYMTPAVTAEYMASLFPIPVGRPVRLLDAGAGVGSLTTAFVERFSSLEIVADCWEVDPVMEVGLTVAIDKISASHPQFRANICAGDFIENAVMHLMHGTHVRYTHAIQNPPYSKINAKSKHRLLMRNVGIETVNLYTAFMSLTILLLEPQGEFVAIIPRSFCNGTYYLPFREFLLKYCAISHIHLFESRKKTFKEDDVLQENIIIRLVKGVLQSEVTVTMSHGPEFSNLNARVYSFADIVKPGDANCFIHIPAPSEGDFKVTSPLFRKTLKDIEIEVCTGPVVDFRMSNDTRKEIEPGAVPLIYPHHLKRGKLEWPKEHKKPNAIAVTDDTKRWLMPAGWYVLVKRFSSKEEKRRVVAYVVDPTKLPGNLIGFENHWNVFHIKKSGLNKTIAIGLAAFLNSTVVDQYFRVFSGHTQVNATDLRSMKYPSLDELHALGVLAGIDPLDQQAIDELMLRLEHQ